MNELTDRDWQTSTDAHALLDFLYPMKGIHSTQEQPRKLRLYYAALTRQKLDALPAVAEGLVRIAEDIADGLTLASEDFQRLYDVVERVVHSGGEGCAARVSECERRLAELGYSWPTDRPTVPAGWDAPTPMASPGWPLLLAFQSQVPAPSQLRRADHDTDLIRDIYGNPFAPQTIPDEWRSERVVGMAAKCYDDREFFALPLLADALQDEGCPDDHPLVRHCREEPSHTHARGCWAVDLIMKR